MNTLIAIIGLGVLCLLFEILNETIIPMTIIGLLAILGLDISEFNSLPYYNNMIIVSKFSTAFKKNYWIYKNTLFDKIGWNSCHGVFGNLAMFFWE
jgi:hypothetical protein